MKIAIATMSRDISYGGNLQAYALQKTILQNSHSQCLQIARHNKRHSVFVPIRNIRNILTDANRLLHYPQYRRKLNLFEIFQDEYIQFTDMVYTDNNADGLNNVFDCFISGSDQVWNCASGLDSILFLNFANKDKMKVSYAASIGLSKVPEQYQVEFVQAVNSYDHVSVREKRAQEIVEELTKKKATHVLDPVFLLEASEWREHIGQPIEQEKYIFVYATQVSEALLNCVKECQRLTGLKVITVHKIEDYEVIEFKSGPLEFLNYVNNAEYVITSSFHCVAFSMLFSKNVTVIPHSKTGVRVTDLVEMLGAKATIYNGNFNSEMTYDPVLVNSNIEKYRKTSLEFIKDFIEEGECRYG